MFFQKWLGEGAQLKISCGLTPPPPIVKPHFEDRKKKPIGDKNILPSLYPKWRYKQLHEVLPRIKK